jgi:bifunctional DNA primase/polymerase-like protein
MPQARAVPTVFEAALDYAHCGIPVFPCNPIDKKPLTPNGFKDATTDGANPRMVDAMAQRHDRRADGSCERFMGDRRRSRSA